MDTTELQALVNQLKDIREAANWSGKFTVEVREATRAFRYEKIAHPLDDVIAKLETELKRRTRKRSKRRIVGPQHLPYLDN